MKEKFSAKILFDDDFGECGIYSIKTNTPVKAANRYYRATKSDSPYYGYCQCYAQYGFHTEGGVRKNGWYASFDKKSTTSVQCWLIVSCIDTSDPTFQYISSSIFQCFESLNDEDTMRAVLKKYPFISRRSVLEEFPLGWYKKFGNEFLNDVLKWAVKRYRVNYQISSVRCEFGRFAISANSKFNFVSLFLIPKYRKIAEDTCAICGGKATTTKDVINYEPLCQNCKQAFFESSV